MIQKAKTPARQTAPDESDLPKAVSLTRKDWMAFLERERQHLKVQNGQEVSVTVHQAALQLSVEAAAFSHAVDGQTIDPKEMAALSKRMEELAGKLQESGKAREAREKEMKEFTLYQEKLLLKYYPTLDLDEVLNADFIKLIRDTFRITRGEELGN